MLQIDNALEAEAMDTVDNVKGMAADLSEEEQKRHVRQVLMITYVLEKIARYASINAGRDEPQDDDTALKHNIDWVNYMTQARKYLKDIFALLKKGEQSAWQVDYKAADDLLKGFRAFLVSRVPKE